MKSFYRQLEQPVFIATFCINISSVRRGHRTVTSSHVIFTETHYQRPACCILFVALYEIQSRMQLLYTSRN